MEIKRGSTVDISTSKGIIKEEVLSIGGKFITTESYKFHRGTLRQVDPFGVSAYIIENPEKHYQDREKLVMLDVIGKFEFSKLSYEDLDKVKCIIEDHSSNSTKEVLEQMEVI